MSEVLYADSYFFINFAMNYLSLYFTCIIVSQKIKFLRSISAAAIGALYAVLILFLSLKTYILLPLNIAVSLLICFIAFGKSSIKNFLIKSTFFYLTCILFGGLVNALYNIVGLVENKHKITVFIFIAAAAVAYTLWSVYGSRMKKKLEASVISITVIFENKSIELYALVDSGFFAKDPLSGNPVIIVKADSMEEMLPPDLFELLKSGGMTESPKYITKLLAIPILTASGNKVLFGFRPDKVKIHNKAYRKRYKETSHVVVALDFAPGGFAGCPCLIPLSIV